MELNGTITVELGSKEEAQLSNAAGVSASFTLQREMITKNAKNGVAVFRMQNADVSVTEAEAPVTKKKKAKKAKKAEK